MVVDMRTGGVSNGGSPGRLADLAGAEMARYWRLPHVATGGYTDSKIPDEQAAKDAAAAVLLAILEGSDMAYDVGGMDLALTHSAELMTLTNDIILEMRGILRGVPTDDESLALDVVRGVGIGGQFLACSHTLRHL